MQDVMRACLGRILVSACMLVSACNFADLEQGEVPGKDMGVKEDLRDMAMPPVQDMMQMMPPDMRLPQDLGGGFDLGEDMTLMPDMPDMLDMGQGSPDADMDKDLGSEPPVCGNSVVEAGELCDGNCPQTCTDGDACTRDVRAGSDVQCNVVCSYPTITTCVFADGCCPPGCTDMQDNDCPSSGIDCKNAATWPSSWQATANMAKTRVDLVRQSGMCNGASYSSTGALSRNAQLDEAARCVAIWFQKNPDADQNELLSKFLNAISESGYQGVNVDVKFIGGRSSTITKAEDRLFATSNSCQDVMSGQYQDVGVAYLDTMPSTSNHFFALVLGRKN